MKCPRCDHENRVGAKFCEQCAFALNRHCAQCGEPLPATAKFCPECAHPAPAMDALADDSQTAASAAASGRMAATADGERRQATLLAADICGYSALCTKLDAEQVQALLGRFYDITDSIVANYGGHIIDHAGDATLAVFGAPVAHDNDAERAVRAALDMHAQAAQLTDPLSNVLRLHVGIASGEVVAATITGGAQPKYSVTGDAANLSARLNALAQSGDTLVTDAVFRNVANKIQAHSLGDVAVKGFDKPIGVWRIQDLRRGPAERRPFVGRQTEMRQLLSIAEGIAESNNGAAVLVRGDAGIGKSRLLEQLRHATVGRGFSCHVGHVLDFGVGKGRDAIPAIVKNVLEVSAHAEPAVLEEAIERALQAGLLAADEVIFINDLLEVDHNAEQRVRFHALDSATRVRRTGETIVALLERSCAVRPCVVAIEDVHWASPDLLRYLALLTRAASSNAMLLVMTSRFEGDPLDRLWRGSTRGSALMTIDLGPLRTQDAKLLAGGLFETSNDLAIECIERAEGNPLFLEQLLRNVLESKTTHLPATIQSLVLARMDRLSARDKIALQVASVIGQSFPLITLRALAADTTYRCNALIEADLVRPDGDDFLFAHALIQEGVYSSLLNSRKRELHRKAADWYGDTELIVSAEHLERAGDPGAARAYLRAAQDQTSKFRHAKALELSDNGIALFAAAGAEPASPDATHCALTLLRGELLRELGRSEESIAAFRAAHALATEDQERYRAWMGIVAGHRVTGDIEVAMQALDEADAIVQKLDLAVERSRVHHTRGNLFFAIGDVDACCAQHEAALLSAEQAGDTECKAQALSGLGDANYAQGRALSAVGFFQRCVDLCEGASLQRHEIPNRSMVGHCLHFANQFDRAVAQCRRACDDASRNGFVQLEIFSQESLGLILVDTGKYDEAELALQHSLALARTANSRRYQSIVLYCLAVIRLSQGETEQAREYQIEGLELARQTGMGFIGAALLAAKSRVAHSEQERRSALDEGEALTHESCIAHSRFWFYRDAIESALDGRDWASALRYANALEQCVSAEPLPWVQLIAARGRALANTLSGRSDEANARELKRIRADALATGFGWALQRIDPALATCAPQS